MDAHDSNVNWSSENHDVDDISARLSGIKIRAYILVHGKTAPLIPAEGEGGRVSTVQKGHKCDLYVAVNHCELDYADKAADCGSSRTNRATKKCISTTGTRQEDADYEENK